MIYYVCCSQKPPENPKDAQVAAPLMEIYKEVRYEVLKYIDFFPFIYI